MTVATLRVRLGSGATAVFEALHVEERRDGRVLAIGRWRYDSGRRSTRRMYIWPRRRVLEVRFHDVEAVTG